MVLGIYWTDFAKRNLRVIAQYYEKKAGSKVAQKIVEGIIGATKILEKNPFLGQREFLLVERPQQYRYLVHSPFKIIYWVNTGKRRIDITTVFDTRQDPLKIKKVE